MQKSTSSIYKTLFRPKLILLILLIVSALGLLIIFFDIKGRSAPDFAKVAKNINNRCSGGSDTCFSDFFYGFAKANDFRTSHAILSELKKINPSIRICHKIAHNISIAEVEKKPEVWRDVFGVVPPEECSYGFFHGVIEGAFKVAPDIKIDSAFVDSVCNEELISKTGISRSQISCAHAFGHILLVQNEGVVNLALSECQNTATSIKNSCYQGVFMENIQKENLSDHGIAERAEWTSDYLKKEKKFCEGFSGGSRDECWRSLGPLINSVSRHNHMVAVNHCSEAALESSRGPCVREVLGKLLVDSFANDTDVKVDYCAFSESLVQYRSCLKSVISYVLLTSKDFLDPMIKYCSIVKQETRSECLETIRKY